MHLNVNGKCIVCSKFALYLCSKCQQFWYCSPQCQVGITFLYSLLCSFDFVKNVFIIIYFYCSWNIGSLINIIAKIRRMCPSRMWRNILGPAVAIETKCASCFSPVADFVFFTFLQNTSYHISSIMHFTFRITYSLYMNIVSKTHNFDIVSCYLICSGAYVILKINNSYNSA